MAWYGWCEFDGTEIINVERTETYVADMPWFKRTYGTDALETVFNTSYNTPLVDDAPWTDPDRMESYDFYGVYPLAVEGIENSTRESNVIQYIRDGGNPGRLRHGTKSIVFNTVLMGASECAVEYGFNWLKSALLGAPCSSNGTTRCNGSSLSYFSCEPVVNPDDPAYPDLTEPVYAILDGGTEPTAPSQLLVSDSFNRFDNDETLGMAETGQTWESERVTINGGIFGIDANRAQLFDGIGSAYVSAVVETESTDVTIEVLITASSDLNRGIRLRSSGPDTGLSVLGSAVWDTAFSSSQVGPSFGSNVATGDRMRVTAKGTAITVDKQTGGVGAWTNIYAHTTSLYQGNTKHGIAAWGTVAQASRWEDFMLYSDTPLYPVVDGGAPDTVFTNSFDGGAPNTDFPIELSEPLPEPFQPNPVIPNPDPTGCIASLTRTLYDVQFNAGPEITAKKILTDGSCIWTVQFTAVAGNPFEYGEQKVIVENFLGADEQDPLGPDVDGPFDTIGSAHEDMACPPVSWSAVYDPLCPALVAPPAPVSITAGCFEATNDWWRRYFTIPKEFIPLWGLSVPLLRVSAQFDDLRQVRIRFYKNETEMGIDGIEQCEFVGDLLLSYVPQDTTLVVDGVNRRVYVEDADGVRRRADSLVFTSDGLPLEWPELTCGYGYIVTVDTAEITTLPEVDLSLVAKVV